MSDEETPRKPSSSETIKLSVPVEFGKEQEPVTELVIKPTTRAFREFSLPMTKEGTIMYQPYELAKVGCQMAGHTPGFVDRLNPKDMNNVAQVVLSFLI